MGYDSREGVVERALERLAWEARGFSFGYQPDQTVGRYEEALNIVVPLLREGEATYAGRYHSALQQINIARVMSKAAPQNRWASRSECSWNRVIRE